MRTAEREGIALQVRNFVRQAETERSLERAEIVAATRAWSAEAPRYAGKSVPYMVEGTI
jgi:hypothetical protein